MKLKSTFARPHAMGADHWSRHLSTPHSVWLLIRTSDSDEICSQIFRNQFISPRKVPKRVFFYSTGRVSQSQPETALINWAINWDCLFGSSIALADLKHMRKVTALSSQFFRCAFNGEKFLGIMNGKSFWTHFTFRARLSWWIFPARSAEDVAQP